MEDGKTSRFFLGGVVACPFTQRVAIGLNYAGPSALKGVYPQGGRVFPRDGVLLLGL